MHILELVWESIEIMSIKVLAHFLEHKKVPGVSSQKWFVCSTKCIRTLTEGTHTGSSTVAGGALQWKDAGPGIRSCGLSCLVYWSYVLESHLIGLERLSLVSVKLGVVVRILNQNSLQDSFQLWRSAKKTHLWTEHTRCNPDIRLVSTCEHNSPAKDVQLIHPLSKDLLSTYSEPGTVEPLPWWKLHSCGGDRQ